MLDDKEIMVQTKPQRGLLLENVDSTELLAKRGRDEDFPPMELLDQSGATCAEAASILLPQLP